MQSIFSLALYFCVYPLGSCLVPFIASNGFVHKVDCLKRVNKSEGVLCLFNGKFLKTDFSVHVSLFSYLQILEETRLILL